MKAYRVEAGSRKAVISDIEKPKVGPQDVLIKVASAGLTTGVFRMIEMGMLKELPATVGVEVAGAVEEVGPMVSTLNVGQRVRVHPSLSCGSCDYCASGNDNMCPQGGIMGFQSFTTAPNPTFLRYRDGGLAEYVVAPYWLVDSLPDNVSFAVGAKLHSAATAVSVLRRADLKAGSVVLVTAATGAMGTSIVKMAHFFGIRNLVLISRTIASLKAVAKLSLVPCELIGIDELDSDWTETQKLVQRIRKVFPAGVDSFIDLTPHGKDLWQALGALRINGTMVHLGANSSPLGVPMVALMAQFWRISGLRFHSRQDARDLLKWLGEGRLQLEDLITHRYGFGQVDEAVEQLMARTVPSWMSVIDFDS